MATKEDISGITSKIEIIKTNIQSSNLKQQDWFFESKKAVLDYYDNYVLWANDSMKQSIIVINNSTQPDIIRKTIDELNHQHSKVTNSLWRIFLYESDNEFTERIKTIYEETSVLHKLYIGFYLDIEGVAVKFNKFNQFAEKGVLLKQLHKDLKTERSSLLNKFFKERDSIKVDTLELTEKTMQIIRKKLKEKYPAVNSV
ncbi:hypothetical protein [Prolixibacter bellariivorans]|uniref:hypothetical protein n=1 Tax=Prolixibacter bellariivorans TaxID=314319 RepID=UPI00146FC81D|nr:hypothetical protein [Prolixibacter bellariivorans]